jgi:hypothetical protein
MSDIPPSERVRDAWESWSTDRRRAAIRAVLHRVLIKPLPPGPTPTSPGNSKNTALRRERNWRSCGSASNSTGACSDHAATAAAQTSPLCRWPAAAASCSVARRRAGITQERGEQRDRGRVLNALGKPCRPGSGAHRPRRPAGSRRVLVAERAAARCHRACSSRPPVPPPASARHGRTRARDPGRDHPGAVTHPDRPRARRTPPASVPAVPGRAARAGGRPPVPAQPGARPPGHARQPVTSAPLPGAWQGGSQGAVPAGSRACAGPGDPAGPLTAGGASGRPARSMTRREV